VELRVDGKPVFAATGGRAFSAGQPAVVMIHGAGMDHIVWALPARSLAHRGRAVLAIDLPGHGRSAGPALASIAEMAAWLVRFLDAAGIGQAALCGHSMGSLIALETAAAAPDRVTRLALLGVAARMPVHPDLLAAAKADPELAADLITSWGHGPVGHFGGQPVPGLTRNDFEVLEDGKLQPISNFYAVENARAKTDVRPEADASAVPAPSPERFRRKDFGHMEIQITIDDAKAYTKPWTVKEDVRLIPDTELLEYVCVENEKDYGHLIGK